MKHRNETLQCLWPHQHSDGQQAPQATQWPPATFLWSLMLLSHCKKRQSIHSNAEVIESSETNRQALTTQYTGINAHRSPWPRPLSLMKEKGVITCQNLKL